VTQSRLFFALLPEPELAGQLYEFSRSIKTRPGESVTKVDMIHMTLRYIGSVSSEIRQCLISYSDALLASPFKIQLNKIGCWKKPKVIWCGPAMAGEDLLGLVEKLEIICQKCDIKAESRSFKPHVTLLRGADYLRDVRLPELLLWQVNYLVLMESVTHKAGVKYQVIKSWSLI